MQIKRLEIDDIEQAIALEKLVYEHVSGTSLKSGNRSDHWFKTIDQELAVGMFNGNELIGLSYAVDQNPGMNDPRYRQDNLLIHPDFAGKGKGLGKQLFESLLAMIDSSSPENSSFGYVGDDNKAMQALHERYGSVAGGNEHTYTKEGRTYRPWTRSPFAHIIPEPD